MLLDSLSIPILTWLFGFDVESYCALNTRPLAALKNGSMMGGPTLTQKKKTRRLEEVEGALKEEGVEQLRQPFFLSFLGFLGFSAAFSCRTTF